MFDYTLSALELVMKDVKRISRIVLIVLTALLTSYYTYISAMRFGKLYITIPLAVICFAYLIFLLVTLKKEPTKVKKNVAKAYRYSKLLIHAISLSMTIYEIYLAIENVNAVTVVFAALSSIAFVLSTLFEVFIFVAEPRLRLLAAGLLKDFDDNCTKPLNKIRAIKGDPKLEVDLTPFDKEIETLRPYAEEKQSKRKQTRKETWQRRIPILSWFKGKKKEEKAETEAVDLLENADIADPKKK